MRKTPEQEREAKRRYNQIYRADHREELLAKDNAKYAANREERCAKERERDHAKRAADPEGERAKVRARYAKNPGPTLERCRKARAENPEWFRTLEQLRREKDQEKYRAIDATKRQRRAAAMEATQIKDLSAEQWEEIQAVFNWRCAYCPPNCWRCSQKKHKLHQDHITPLSEGGSHTLANVVPACKSCNSKKHTGPPPIPVQPLLLTLAPAKQERLFLGPRFIPREP